jgi:hypothetical protein
MIVAERSEALEKLSSIAALSGINMGMNKRSMRLEGSFELPGGRTQVCFVRPSGMVGDKFVVTFFSACLRVKKGFLAGITKEMALDLLRRNENLIFARYGVIAEEDADLVVASADYLLDSLDPEEFEHAIWHVALAADSYENEMGKGRDEF